MRSKFRHYSFLAFFALVFRVCATEEESFVKNVLLKNVDLYIPTIYAQNDGCRNHSLFYLEQLKEFRLWAMEMFDATTKFPSGLLYGSTYDLGNFDECLEIKATHKDDDFKGKYCLAKVTVNKIDYEALQQEINWEKDDYKRYFNLSVVQKVMAYKNSVSRTRRNEFHISYCLPSSCTHNDLKYSLQNITKNLKFDKYDLDIDINEKDCQTDEAQYTFNKSDIIFSCVCGIYIAIILTASTLYKLLSPSRKGIFYKLIKCLAVTENSRKILSVKNRNEDGLDNVSGMKVVSMLLIILGHRCMFTFGSALSDPKFVEQLYGKVEASVLLNGTIVVDTFFIIGGFLATYLLLGKFSRKNSTMNIPLIFLHRLLRIIPIYGVILAFYSTLFTKIGSGPFWKQRIGEEQERCSENWWTNLLFINNYINIDKICMFQSWFLDCDMHYFLATPFLVWIIIKRSRLGLIVVLLLLVASLIAPSVIVFVNNYDAILLLYMRVLKDPVLSNTFRNIYIPSHMRAAPYLMGIVTGYIKHKIKTAGYKFPKQIVYIGWLISVFLMLMTVYSGFLFYMPDGIQSKIFSAFYSSMHHFTWSLSICWMIVAISEGHGGIVTPFFAWKPFMFMGRITYSTFLVHGAIQIYSVATIRSPMHVSIFNIVYYTLGDVFCSYFLGFFITVFFESPVVQLEKILLGGKPREKKNSTVAQIYKQNVTNIINCSVTVSTEALTN